MPPLSMQVLARSLRGAGRLRHKHRMKNFPLTREKIQAYGAAICPFCAGHMPAVADAVMDKGISDAANKDVPVLRAADHG